MPTENQTLDVSRYANEAMARLVSAPAAERFDWREIVERGINAAREQSDAEGLVSMVQLLVQLLEGQGRFEDALEEVDHGLIFARASADATMYMYGFKASIQSAMGRFVAAKESLGRAETRRADASLEAQVRHRVFRKVALWQSFEDEPSDPAEDLLQECADHGFGRDRMFLLSWFVPYLASLGDHRRARPWIREMRLEAQRTESLWRLSDVLAFDTWDRFFGQSEFGREPGELDRRNALSVWHCEGVRLRDSVLRQDPAATETSLHALLRARRRLGSAAVGSIEQLERAASLGSQALDDLGPGAPPEIITMGSLGPILGEAEVIANRGSQRAAAEWLERLVALLPAGVLSVMAWPVSVPRVLGLLALRTGNQRRARVALQDSITWTASAGFVVEHALSRLQFGELCASADVKMAERTWKAHRREGAEALKSRGYDPVPHAYAVAHSLTLSTRNRLAERLTRREVQVLGLLADGLSYRKVAEQLEVAAPTVQTLAHRVYQKLGVSGRDAATAEARRLGVL